MELPDMGDIQILQGEMKELKEKASELKERWMWIDTVHKDSPRLFEWMGYNLSKELPKPPSIIPIST